MEELKSWWDIAQLAGAGAALVLGPACWILWQALEKANMYIRTSDKESLTVLSGLSTVITRNAERDSEMERRLIECIDRACERIVAHIEKQTLKDRKTG